MSLRVALVGCGFFGRFQAEAWARIEDATLVALVDVEVARARALAERLGVRDVHRDVGTMLAAVRPDLLDIATPESSHATLVAEAAARRIAVVCQKPLAPSLGKAEAMVATAEAAGIPFLVHENFRFQPWYRETRRLLDAGVFGRVHGLSFRLRPGDGQGPRAYLDRQPYFQALPRFLVHETAVHLIDVFRYLAGEPEAVYARLYRRNPAVSGEDAGVIVLEFPGPVIAVFDGDRHVDFPADDPRLSMGTFQLDGTAASLRLDGWGRLWLKPHGRPEAEHGYAWSNAGPGGNSVEAFQRHVVRHLAHGEPAETAAHHWLRNMVVEEAVYRSSASGRRLRLPPPHQARTRSPRP